MLNLGALEIPLNKPYDAIYRWLIRIHAFEYNICIGLTCDYDVINSLSKDETKIVHGGLPTDKFYGFGNGNYKIVGQDWNRIGKNASNARWKKNVLI